MLVVCTTRFVSNMNAQIEPRPNHPQSRLSVVNSRLKRAAAKCPRCSISLHPDSLAPSWEIATHASSCWDLTMNAATSFPSEMLPYDTILSFARCILECVADTLALLRLGLAYTPCLQCSKYPTYRCTASTTCPYIQQSTPPTSHI